MPACPYCRFDSIPWWRKAFGSSIECPECRRLSTPAGWAAELGVLLFPLFGVALVVALFMKSRGMVLGILIATLLWLTLVAVLVKLKPTADVDRWAEWRAYNRNVYVAVWLVIVITLLMKDGWK